MVQRTRKSQWLSTFDGGVIHVGDWRRDPDLSRLSGRFHVFSHDSRLVLSFDNGQVVLQDTASGERMCSLTMPQSYNIDDWIFTPDDHFAILSSNQDLTTYVWDLRALKMELKALGFGWKSEVIPDPTSTLGEAR